MRSDERIHADSAVENTGMTALISRNESRKECSILISAAERGRER